MKRKPVKSDEVMNPDVEHRPYTSTPGSSGVGRTRVYLHCPFCHHTVAAYLWSLAGTGRRCDCGALFGSLGEAHKWKEPGQ